MRFVVREHSLCPGPVEGVSVFQVVERYRDFPLAVVVEKPLVTVFDRKSAEAVADALNAQRREGIVEGMTRFAWWQSGEQFVGTTGTRLKDAVADLDREGEPC